MNKTTSMAVLLAGLLLAAGSPATAQETKGFVDVNGGAQTQGRSLQTSTSFPLYGETAIINAAQDVDGGGLFDISGGYRIRPTIAVGLGFSVFSKSGDGSLIASLPDPLIRNRPANVSASGSGLKHSEVGTHLMVVWMVPLLDKIDATVFAGPSFFRVSQDVMTATVPAGTQTANVATQREKGNATGANVGINLNYMLTPRYGLGIFLRYAGASADLPSAENIDVGGFQVGGGLRLRF